MLKAYRLVYHSTLGLRVIKKKKKKVSSGFAVSFCLSRGHLPPEEGGVFFCLLLLSERF